ncbi:MAG TPA: malto-oligosyltrehalose synthase, partial [Gaiellaceae bacterium]|nr:malto-oligosyltrehalose synthase [Gaiellaceae bacterium]
MSFRATYRLQLQPGFGFREARELVPYLQQVGVSHLYLSPIMRARSGSTHGYDVVDPTQVSPELGGEEAFRELANAGLGVVLDVVPNHMAVSDENRFWREQRSRVFDVEESGWYRRFFTIDELAGVRVEDPDVFELTHAKTLQLVEEGLVDGLRIDHPDGLADPRGYLERLRDRGVRHVWVEKILEPGEHLRDWPVEGTTGYEFANDVTALFVDPRGEEPLTSWYESSTGERRPFADIAQASKLELARADFRREFGKLRSLLDAGGGDSHRLEEAASSLDVYRTYVEPWSGRVEAADRDALASVPDDVRRILLLEERGHDEFVTRFQQTTGPVMAKGVEDTALYRYFRLTALNEVGGDPGRFWLPVDEFHRANLERAERFPLHLLTTQTHDTKRSGDVRARIVALSWLGREWAVRRSAWRALEDASEDELLWQTLVGAWPIEAERLEAYMQKALREGKVNTSWADPNEAHERAVRETVRRVVADRPDGFGTFAARVAELGQRIALGMTLLKLTVPGVPDLYQGDELESFNLVDPDNRRPVDWEARRRALAEPSPKLRVILEALGLRARRELGEYRPLELGPDVCAFQRGDDVAVVVPLRGQDPPQLG